MRVALAKGIIAVLIMCAFWGLMIAPAFWPWLAPIPLLILGVATVRSFMASLRK
jgi:hypothetical protein